MCHQRFWSLGCGHPCFIDKFCPDSFEEPGTHIRHLCLNATARPGTPGSEDAVCRQPLCPYGKDSWRCCACGGWNNEIAECSNVMSPEVDAHHSEDDGNPHGIDQTPLCPHHRCAVCTAGPAVPPDGGASNKTNREDGGQSDTGSDKEKQNQGGHQDVTGDRAPSQSRTAETTRTTPNFPLLPSPALPLKLLSSLSTVVQGPPEGPSWPPQLSRSTAPEGLPAPIPSIAQQPPRSATLGGGLPALAPSLLQQATPSPHFPQMPSSSTSFPELPWPTGAYPRLAGAPSNPFSPVCPPSMGYPLPALNTGYPQQASPATVNPQAVVFSSTGPRQPFFSMTHSPLFSPTADQRRPSVHPTGVQQPSAEGVGPPQPSPNAIQPRRYTLNVGDAPPRLANWVSPLSPTPQRGTSQLLPSWVGPPLLPTPTAQYQPALASTTHPQPAPFGTTHLQPPSFNTAYSQPPSFGTTHPQPPPFDTSHPQPPRSFDTKHPQPPSSDEAEEQKH